MVNVSKGRRPPDEPLDRLFAALADPTRRAIVARLAEGEASVGELAKPFAISAPAVTKHLQALERAGLVARERDGRVHRIQLRREPLLGAFEWIARYGRFWEEQLDALEAFLERQDEAATRPPAARRRPDGR